jgi:two-component system phosphate regulon response regulator PhoB
VRYCGRPVRLSPLQHALLCHLATSPRRVFAVDELLRDVWGYETPVATTRTVAANACRLRRSLQRVGGGHLVDTVRGRGYRLLAA